MMSRLDFGFQGKIFERLLALPIDILALETECFCDDCFVAGLADYLDFFWVCMFSVNSPMIRFNSSFSRLSLLYSNADTTPSPAF